jgi:uncharacterized Ntn-hydrolase superfamily protein
MRRQPHVAIITLVGIWFTCTVFADSPRVFQCEPDAMVQTRQKWREHDPSVTDAVKKIRDEADKALRGGPYAVTQKRHPAPGGDPHDYVSLAPYFWPNLDTPDHLPYVRHDGKRNPEIREYDATRMSEMSSHVYALALGYYFNGDEKYAQRAALLLRSWFIDDATRMNPNLTHAQLVKGENEGRPTGIIESLRFLNVIDASGLLHGSAAWTQDDQQKMESWFRHYLKWMLESKTGMGEDKARNNHGSWYDVQVVIFSLFLGDSAQARRVAEAAKERRIAKQIEPDGSQPLELTRTKSFGYSVYNVFALTELADLAKRVDVDLWNFKTADGRSIRGAVDYLLPYAMNEKQWTHEQLDGLAPGGLFVPLRRAAAAYHDPKYEAVCKKIMGNNASVSREAVLHPETIMTSRASDLPGTFSILGYDADTGEVGGAVQSRVFSVGNGVLWAEAGVGAVATQAIVDVSYGPQCLDLLRKGIAPADIIKQVWDNDPDPRPRDWTKQGRQFAVINVRGEAAAFTGPKATPWAGHKLGKYCTAQGNILAGAEVVDLMVDAFEKTGGHLSNRLVAALEAGQAAGGDKRGKQSAAILIVKKDGGVWLHNDTVLRLQVDDNPEPIHELRRLVDKWGRQQGPRK